MGGASPAPILELLKEHGRMDEAMAFARLALLSCEPADRPTFEGFLEAGAASPEGWTAAVLSFAAQPSLGGWDDLMRFVPPNARYHRTRNTLRILSHLGLDPNLVFLCATRPFAVPEAFELAEAGAVDPSTIVEHAYEAPRAERGLWLAEAAQAALIRGDDFGTVRLLKLAYEEATEDDRPDPIAKEIRRNSDEALNKMMDAAGIPDP